MKISIQFFLLTLVLFIQYSITSYATPTETKIIEHVTVNNLSDIALLPTGEGVSEGCVGGSMPPFLNPVEPHTTRVVDLIFIQYFPSCRFDVLPLPNILTYLQACHNVKGDDTVVYTGHDLSSLRCHVL